MADDVRIRVVQAIASLLLVVGCGAGGPSKLGPQVSDTRVTGALRRLPDLDEPRASHTATALADGTVLVAGGFRKGPDGRAQLYSDTALIYEPAEQRFVATGRLVGARCGHTATRLADGRVLLAGGYDDAGVVASAELYDPASRSFSSVGDMTSARGGFTASLLADGDVLMVGGGSERTPFATVERYHPALGTFAPAAALQVARLGHTATGLGDGRILVVGGQSQHDQVTASAEIYDPVGGSSVRVGELAVARYKHAAIRLDDGAVLVIGGSDLHDWSGQLASAERFDPAAQAFVSAGELHAARFKLPAALALLPGGRVLVAGGNAELELFDPASGGFARAASMQRPSYYGTSTALPDGGVLIVGGYDDRVRTSERAWLFSG
jgi:Galactose oxidase, central domain